MQVPVRVPRFRVLLCSEYRTCAARTALSSMHTAVYCTAGNMLEGIVEFINVKEVRADMPNDRLQKRGIFLILLSFSPSHNILVI